MDSSSIHVPPRYIVNSAGEKTDVVLTIDDYQRLLDHLKTLEALLVTSPSKAVRTEEIFPMTINASLAMRKPPILIVSNPPQSVNRAATSQDEDVYVYEMPRKGACARAYFRDPKMIVLRGSKVAPEATQSMPWRYERMRRHLIEIGVIAADGEGDLEFTRNYPFETTTEAVCVIEGGSRSGYESWRNAAGKTLHDLGFFR